MVVQTALHRTRVGSMYGTIVFLQFIYMVAVNLSSLLRILYIM